MSKNTVLDPIEVQTQVENGLTRVQLAEHFGVPLLVIYRETKMHRDALQRNAFMWRQVRDEELKAAYKLSKEAKKEQIAQSAKDTKRLKREAWEKKNAHVREMFLAGGTLRSIGADLGVSYQRVNQIIKKFGLTTADGGSAQKRAAARREREALKLSDANAHADLYGISKSEWRKRLDGGFIDAYRHQKRSAQTRGIGWSLTFLEWVGIWESSGKWQERGRTGDGCCMSRKDDLGPYAVGNVEIKTLRENSREAFTRKSTKSHVGVFNILKGRKLSWLAKYNKTHIGWYATEEEAVAARNQYLADNCINPNIGLLGSGKGYSFRHGAYVVQCAGRQTRHKTEEEAQAAYQSAVAAVLASRQQHTQMESQ
jgi:hypothetical protein